MTDSFELDSKSLANQALFQKTFIAVKDSMEEQIRIERAVGKTILDRLNGKETDLIASYKAIGGIDPAVVLVFSDMNDEILKIDMSGPKRVATNIANKQMVASAKSASIQAGNPVFNIENTALNTLAEMGGTEFAKRFAVQK